MPASYAAIIPNRCVPCLEDGDFGWNESSAILNTSRTRSARPTYPKDPKKRAKINELMELVHTPASTATFGYNFVFRRFSPIRSAKYEAAQAGNLEFGRTKAKAWLKNSGRSLLGRNKKFLLGDEPTNLPIIGARAC